MTFSPFAIKPGTPSFAPTRSLTRRVVLVLNPGAGHFLASQRRLNAAMQRAGLQIVETLDIREVDRLTHWVTLAPSDRPMVVAGGGDGTVGTVAGYVANTGTVLGILPLGTHNDTARSLGIPRRIEDAVNLLASGKVSTIDAARFVPCVGEPRYFVQAAAMGIQVAFARLATKTSVRKRLGRFTYLVTTVAALRERHPLTCELVVDGKRIRTRLLYLGVFNAPIFGGPLRLRLPGASIDNRQLEVLVIGDMPLYRLLLAMGPMLFARAPRMRGVAVYWTPRLEVEAEHPLDVTLDGEIDGQVPGTFVLAPEALRVVTPQDFEDVDD